MSEEQNQSAEEMAASVLKEVNQKTKDNPEANLNRDAQPSAEEISEQSKGSDADVDQRVGFDNKSDVNDTKEQIKGADADSD